MFNIAQTNRNTVYAAHITKLEAELSQKRLDIIIIKITKKMENKKMIEEKSSSHVDIYKCKK